MPCRCSSICVLVLYPLQLVIAYILRGLIYIVGRASQLGGTRFMSLDLPPDTQIIIQSSRGKRDIRVDIYKPPQLVAREAQNMSKERGEKVKYPVHINAHG